VKDRIWVASPYSILHIRKGKNIYMSVQIINSITRVKGAEGRSHNRCDHATFEDPWSHPTLTINKQEGRAPQSWSHTHSPNGSRSVAPMLATQGGEPPQLGGYTLLCSSACIYRRWLVKQKDLKKHTVRVIPLVGGLHTPMHRWCKQMQNRHSQMPAVNRMSVTKLSCWMLTLYSCKFKIG